LTWRQLADNPALIAATIHAALRRAGDRVGLGPAA
jgi:hypothetical protein